MKLPVEMQQSFIRAIKTMQSSHKNTHRINSNWQMYHCPESNNYYAVQTDANSTISANTACIRKAYRIEPGTGNFLTERMNMEGYEEHFMFAVKHFDSPKRENEAKIEAETLKQHQFAESVFRDDANRPIVISVYYPGLPLTKLETAQTQEIVKVLSFFQRIDLCYQLAKQYHDLHHHKDGAKLHIDVKGQNTIIYKGPSDERWRARLIDFGSVKCVENSQKPMPTTIAGMTEYALPPEVFSEPLRRGAATWHMDTASGSVSEKSDIYAFSAIIMSLLGATNPYQHRHVQQDKNINSSQLYDINALSTLVGKGFSTTGMFSYDSEQMLKYHFSEKSCSKLKKQNGLAPPPETVLASFAKEQPCYLAYDNYLLCVEGGKVSGYDRRLRNLHQALTHIEDGAVLTADALASLDALSGNMRMQTGEPLQNILIVAISEFLNLMQEQEPDKRPSSKDVYAFFEKVYAMCHLSEHQKDIFKPNSHPKNLQMIERQLQIMHFQLELIIRGLEIPLKPMEWMLAQKDFPDGLFQLKQYLEAYYEYCLNPDKASNPKPHPWLETDEDKLLLSANSMFPENIKAQSLYTAQIYSPNI